MDGNSTSEDCLYLNIFVRGDTFLNSYVESKPIMIWIDGVQNTYEPSTLVATSDVIVVSFNYRLGVFGFLSLENTEASGNAGFLDQHMAIKWVYENAKYFGGDNTKITLFGQDAGALSVGYHLFYPESWPYFRNGIMQSGSPTGNNDNFKTIFDSLQFILCYLFFSAQNIFFLGILQFWSDCLVRFIWSDFM
jgi:carboxylesterase type B